MEEQTLPRIILICSEGEKTEPDYFTCVISQRRINQGVARVVVVGNLGQHQALISRAVEERNKLCTKLELNRDEVEVWAVCDKDRMQGTLAQLEEYAAQRSVKVGFSNPRFEIFLLQHFTPSASNLTSRRLEALLSAAMKRKGVNSSYDKTDLSWLYPLLDAEPLILEQAIRNSSRIADSSNTPHVTVHLLLQRLLSLAP